MEYSYAEVQGNVFSNNATSSPNNAGTAIGGGIGIAMGAPWIHNNVFFSNQADSGGGIFAGDCDGLFTGNVFLENKATYGAGIALTSDIGRPVLTNNTFARNRIGSAVRYGGSPVIENNIVAFNTRGGMGPAPSGGGQFGPTVKNNDVWGNALFAYANTPDLTGMNGNLAVNPPLANLAVNNVHVRPGSP